MIATNPRSESMHWVWTGNKKRDLELVLAHDKIHFYLIQFQSTPAILYITPYDRLPKAECHVFLFTVLASLLSLTTRALLFQFCFFLSPSGIYLWATWGFCLFLSLPVWSVVEACELSLSLITATFAWVLAAPTLTHYVATWTGPCSSNTCC